MSTLSSNHIYPPEDTLGTHFFQKLDRSQSHRASGRIKSMKNSFYPIENRTRDLPACSTVPQPTTPHRISAQRNESVNLNVEMESNSSNKKGKVQPCTGIEALYRPYGP